MPADQQPIPPNLREAVEVICSRIGGGLDANEIVTSALRALLAQGWFVGRWEPINNHKSDGKNVLIYAPGEGEATVAAKTMAGWIPLAAAERAFTRDGNDIEYEEPTHFMPLPSPPVGAADER